MDRENGVGHALATFISQTRARDLDKAARRHAHWLLIDAVGCALAGYSAAEVPLVERALRRLSPETSTSVLGGARTSLLGAAFLNAYLTTAITACDVHIPTLCHVTPEVVPAALAVGEHVRSSGEECLAAGLLDELVLVVPPGHAWARRREIAPEQLAGQPLLMREAGSATRSVTERALQRAGVRFRVAMELDHTEAIKRGVMAGLGIAFVSRQAVRGEVAGGRLRALRLRGLRIERHFHVIHHDARRLGASARAFIALRGGDEP